MAKDAIDQFLDGEISASDIKPTQTRINEKNSPDAFSFAATQAGLNPIAAAKRIAVEQAAAKKQPFYVDDSSLPESAKSPPTATPEPSLTMQFMRGIGAVPDLPPTKEQASTKHVQDEKAFKANLNQAEADKHAKLDNFLNMTDEQAKQYEKEHHEGRALSALGTLEQNFYDPLVVKPMEDVGLAQGEQTHNIFEQNEPSDIARLRSQAKDSPTAAKLVKAYDESIDPRNNPIYKAGEKLDKYIHKNLYTNPKYQHEFLTTELPGAIGNFIAYGSASALSGGMIDAPMMMSSTAQSQFQDALAHGASIDDALRSADLARPAGAIPAIPFLRMAGPVAGMLDHYDNISGGLARRIILHAGKQGTEFSAAMGAQTLVQNLIAAKVMKYDPKRNVFQDVLNGSTFTTGALLGVLHAIFHTPPPLIGRNGNGEPVYEQNGQRFVDTPEGRASAPSDTNDPRFHNVDPIKPANQETSNWEESAANVGIHAETPEQQQKQQDIQDLQAQREDLRNQLQNVQGNELEKAKQVGDILSQINKLDTKIQTIQSPRQPITEQLKGKQNWFAQRQKQLAEGVDYVPPEIPNQEPTTSPGAAPEQPIYKYEGGIDYTGQEKTNSKESANLSLENNTQATRRVEQDQRIAALRGRLGQVALPHELPDPRLKREEYRNVLRNIHDHLPASENPESINPHADDILTAIAKSGGLNREEAKAQGIDPAQFVEKTPVPGKPVFPAQGGKSFDAMAETLAQHGYTPENYSANDLLDRVDKAIRGEFVGSDALNPTERSALQAVKTTGLTLEETRNAISKTLDGKRLGVRQAKAITTLLDNHTGERSSKLEFNRQEMAAARAGYPPINAYDAYNENMAGQRYPEHEYLPEMTGQARALYELVHDARAVDPDKVETILDRAGKDPDTDIAKRLYEVIRNGHEQPTAGERNAAANGSEEVPAGSSEQPRTEGKGTQEESHQQEDLIQKLRNGDHPTTPEAADQTNTAYETKYPDAPKTPDEVTQPVDRSYDIPYVAGYSPDGKHVYIDRNIPHEIEIDGKKFDPGKYIALHESKEIHGIRNEDLNYQASHYGLATPTERRAVEADGIDWKKYSDAMAGYTKHIKEKTPERTPANLDMTPYEDMKDTKTIAAIKKAQANVKSDKLDLMSKKEGSGDNLTEQTPKPESEINSLFDIKRIIDSVKDPVFVRWSSGPKYDLKPEAKSRDHQTGETHAGLSAIRLDKNMSIADIAKYISEYGFGRMQYAKNMPYIYTGKIVGKDSDGYPSIRPTSLIGVISKSLVKQLDNKLARKLYLEREINDSKNRLKIITDKFAYSIVQKRLIELEKEFESLKNDHLRRSQGAEKNVSEPVKAETQPAKALPAETQKPTIEQAAHEAATSPKNERREPTEAQKEAGNYKKGHIVINGLDISIENPAGSRRRPEWPPLKNHYGYIRGTIGKDKDHIDVFLGKDAENPDLKVYVVDQVNPTTKRFDEHKVMIGFKDELAARSAYLANYTKGWKGMRDVTPMTLDEFKTWLKSGETQKAAKGYNPTKAEKLIEQTPENKTITASERIQDFGEKLGGARKDTAFPIGKQDARTQDERPGWMRRYEVTQIAADTRHPEIVGKYVITDTKTGKNIRQGLKTATFDTHEEAVKAIPLYEVARNHRVQLSQRKSENDPQKYEIVRHVTDRKRVVIKNGFDSREDAMKYMAQHANEIIEKKTRFDDSIHPALEKAVRLGAERRANGKDIHPTDFKDIFGFRGVEFGNWNNNAERQHILNQAYDAFLDLADMLHIPPEAISLNGELGIGFGSRGHGLSGAQAHYERSYGVINLTKIKGAGALAHEWMHALDHYLGRQGGKAKSEKIINQRGDKVYPASDDPARDYVSHGFGYKAKEQTREELRKAFNHVMDVITHREIEHEYDISSREKIEAKQKDKLHKVLDDFRTELTKDYSNEKYKPYFGKKNNQSATAEQLAKVDKLINDLKDGKSGESIWVKGKGKYSGVSLFEPVAKLSELYKSIRGRQGYSHTSNSYHGPIIDIERAVQNEKNASEFLTQAKEQKTTTKKVATEYYSEAWKMDQGGTKDYWSTPHEMLARAFESYIYDKLKGIDARNDFLSYEKHNNLPEYKIFGIKPYPEGKERDQIDKAFDELFNVLKTKKTDNGLVLFSRRQPDEKPIFYSGLERAVNAIKQLKGTGEQMLAQIKKTPGVKQEEMDWIGLDDYLKGKPTVNKSDLLNFVRKGGVQIHEVQKGKNTTTNKKPISLDDAKKLLKENPDAYITVEHGGRIYPDRIDLINNNQQLYVHNNRLAETKYAKYQLPGGEDYREMLLTLPDRSVDKFSKMDKADLIDEYKNRIGYDPFADDPSLTVEQARNALRSHAFEAGSDENYKSGHFDESNIVAHVRFNTRTDEDGKKVLFIEEVQSDWHQAGRKKGYKTGNSTDDEVRQFFGLDKSVPESDIPSYREEMMQHRDYQKGAVPNAPFKQSWPMLAMKRMIRYAVDNGYDRVAWTTGEQQAERYDLNHQVEEIKLFNHGNDKWDISAIKKGGGLIDIATRIPKEKLDSYIGKDLAKKAIESQTERGWKNYSGLDLEVGGKGMKEFYDKMLPSMVDKYIKKFGGKVGETTINEWEGEHPETGEHIKAGDIVHAFDITPQMRNFAQEGQPLFVRRQDSNTGKNRLQSVQNQHDPANKLNSALVNYGLGKEWEHAYETVELPDSLSDLQKEVQAAFGRNIRPVMPTAERFNVFQGVLLNRDIYFNARSKIGFLNIAGHELYHDIERTRPDLINWYREQAKDYYQDLPTYKDKLDKLLQPGEDPHTIEQAESELLADFMGDSLGDTKFLQQLADSNPSRFKTLLSRVRMWLSTVAGKLRNLGSSKYITDVEGLRAHLKTVLNAYADGKPINDIQSQPTRSAMDQQIRFSRAQADAEDTIKKAKKFTIKALKKQANHAIDAVDDWVNGISGLSDRTNYMTQRMLTMGKVGESQKVAREVYEMFKGVDDTNANALLNFFEDANAKATSIPDPKLRLPATRVKKLIDSIGDTMVAKGIISQEARDKYAGRYLPRLYLAHLLGGEAERAAGSGKLPSKMGYTKARNDELDKEYREIVLGQIRDPAFLASRAVGLPMRDMAILNFLENIASNPNWIASNQLTEWEIPGTGKTRNVTPWWLKNEADRLRDMAQYVDPARTAKMRELADKMDAKAREVLEGMDYDHNKYKQVPDTARYGALRGLVVEKHIYNDLTKTGQFGAGSENAVEKSMAKFVRFWKWTKVVANPPSQVRNLVSNYVMINLSGVPWWRMAGHTAEILSQLKAHKGAYYDIARKYGLMEGSFNASEIGKIQSEMLDMKIRNDEDAFVLTKAARMAQAVYGALHDKTGNWYQNAEMLGKLVKIKHEMEINKMPEAEAVLEATKWLFDYSLINKHLRYMRTMPIGAPFLTYQAKVFPRLLEVAVKHPWRFLPYILAAQAMPMLISYLYNVDNKDVDALNKALPMWLQNQGGAMFLPNKDSKGRWQAVNLGYFFPWSNWTTWGGDIATNLKSAVTPGDTPDSLSSLASDAGMFSGPIPDLISAIMTNKDPFTQRDIVDKYAPGTTQMMQRLGYLYSMMMPPWLTDMGVAGHLYRSVTQNENRFGDPIDSPAQALLRMAGVNLYPIEPEKSRQLNMLHMANEIRKTKADMIWTLRDHTLTPAKRQEMMQEYKPRLQFLSQQLKDYEKESRINPRLK